MGLHNYADPRGSVETSTDRAGRPCPYPIIMINLTIHPNEVNMLICVGTKINPIPTRLCLSVFVNNDYLLNGIFRIPGCYIRGVGGSLSTTALADIVSNLATEISAAPH